MVQRLSENLTYGEIGIREVWHAGLRSRDEGYAGAESFLRELKPGANSVII